MKKVLIITYHFPPQDIIAAYRPKAFAEHLSSFGVRSTVVTPRWEKDPNGQWISFDPERDKVIKEERDGHRVFRIPVPLAGREVAAPSTVRKLLTAVSMIKGHLEPALEATYSGFKSFLNEHLTQFEYDLILGVFSPHFPLCLASEMGNAFNIPFSLDLRDLWANRIIHRAYRPTFKQLIQDKLTAHYWRKWFSKALFFSITSEPWKKKVQKVTGQKGIVVKNGYEEELFSDSSLPDEQFFYLLHTGSIYNHQELERFLDGARGFLDGLDPEDRGKVKIEFLGGERKGYSGSFTSFTLDPFSRIADHLDPQEFSLTPRVPKKEAITAMQRAQILLFPSFPRSPGTYSGKIFDYLGARRPILAFPHDEDVIDELLADSQAGDIRDTPEEIANYLDERFREWKRYGICKYHGDPQRIKKYSRREQVRIFAEEVHRRLGS